MANQKLSFDCCFKSWGITKEKRELARLFDDDVAAARGTFFFLKEIGWIKKEDGSRGVGGRDKNSKGDNDDDDRAKYKVTNEGKAAIEMYSRRWMKNRPQQNPSLPLPLFFSLVPAEIIYPFCNIIRLYIQYSPISPHLE